MTSADRTYLGTFAPTVTLELGPGGNLLCYHSSLRSYDMKITATTPEDELDTLLGGAGATVMAGGHTHVPMLRRRKGSLIMNPGSVGMPYEFGPKPGQVHNLPWAEYGLVSWEDGRLSVELCRVPLDAAEVRAAGLRSGMPHAEWWAQDWY